MYSFLVSALTSYSTISHLSPSSSFDLNRFCLSHSLARWLNTISNIICMRTFSSKQEQQKKTILRLWYIAVYAKKRSIIVSVMYTVDWVICVSYPKQFASTMMTLEFWIISMFVKCLVSLQFHSFLYMYYICMCMRVFVSFLCSTERWKMTTLAHKGNFKIKYLTCAFYCTQMDYVPCAIAHLVRWILLFRVFCASQLRSMYFIK